MAHKKDSKQLPHERRKGEAALSDFAEYVEKQQALRYPTKAAASAAAATVMVSPSGPTAIQIPYGANTRTGASARAATWPQVVRATDNMSGTDNAPNAIHTSAAAVWDMGRLFNSHTRTTVPGGCPGTLEEWSESVLPNVAKSSGKVPIESACGRYPSRLVR